MKTSEKIILITAAALIALLVFGLLALRRDARAIVEKIDAEHPFTTVPVADFERLDLPAHWLVRIRQGRNYQVELAAEAMAALKPRLENRDGTLFFSIEAPDSIRNASMMQARITMPFLEAIKAGRGTHIHLQNFDSDTLRLFLEDGGTFSGKNNRFGFFFLQSSGEVRVDLTEMDI